MTTPQQVTLGLDQTAVELATRLAKAMTADPEASRRISDGEWTVQDVAGVAFLRGLDALARQYLNKG
jgi:hypothetical protein